MSPLKEFVLMGGLGLLMVASGCSRTKSGQRYGAPIDLGAPKITLAELVSKTEVYSGKNVVMDGQFAGKCGDGDFYFKDKFDIIEADPPDPKVCLLNKGTGVRVYGVVKVRATEADEANEPNEVKETGKGRREANEATETKEGSNEDHAEHTVRLAVKGVEIR